MTDATSTGSPTVFALHGEAAEQVFAYAALISADDASLLADDELPSFALDGTRELVERLMKEGSGADDVVRIVCSSQSQGALEDGLADLVPMVRDRATGKFKEAAKLVGTAAPVASGPQGMAALLAVAAVAELADALQQAFAVLQDQLRRIESKLDEAQRERRQADLALAQSAIDIARMAEVSLRHTGAIPRGVGLDTASGDLNALWTRSQNSLAGLESRFASFLRSPEPRADDYLRQLRQLLPHDIVDLRAELVLLGAVATAKLGLDAVLQLETEVTHGRIRALDMMTAQRAAEIEATTSRARRLAHELARRDFGSDLATRPSHPLSGGYLSKMPDALRSQRRLRNLDDLLNDVLAPSKFSSVPSDWIELELRAGESGVIASARSHRRRSGALRTSDATPTQGGFGGEGQP